MYVIVVYDVNVQRVDAVLKTCRRYLTWVQNSVLEGEITEANFLRLKHQLSKIIDKERDSITFYILRTTAYMKRETLGAIKGEPTTVL
ncbi:MAG: CRISPR-associated endonuclease Cas2 [archaeon YNP-LCB-003-016]|jgi:CRISPR-associated protein Cas2|uniref:CRISPR-associated endonuclease Cas2 n=1 Tax=Candidatus Culexarchaeum yellowstonense TaxID=2928963 RepID=UPI0026F1A5F2|nr:CRISPR-associated endonuclease Cas2 [Candidatus Culexarchaeum yellowstonense]MCR6692161.1 CRISPR-associated endonuclease Cas2 [Candidatus Culexarchaeum yellowstonense]